MVIKHGTVDCSINRLKQFKNDLKVILKQFKKILKLFINLKMKNLVGSTQRQLMTLYN